MQFPADEDTISDPLGTDWGLINLPLLQRLRSGSEYEASTLNGQRSAAEIPVCQ